MLSSQNCAYFEYTGDVESTIDRIVCCTKCFENLSNNELVPVSCTRCRNFDFNRVKYETKPDFYPPKLFNAEQNYFKLNMKKLSFKTMSASIKSSFDNVKTSRWMKKKTEYYLQIEGIVGMLTK